MYEGRSLKGNEFSCNMKRSTNLADGGKTSFKKSPIPLEITHTKLLWKFKFCIQQKSVGFSTQAWMKQIARLKTKQKSKAKMCLLSNFLKFEFFQ